MFLAVRGTIHENVSASVCQRVKNDIYTTFDAAIPLSKVQLVSKVCKYSW